MEVGFLVALVTGPVVMALVAGISRSAAAGRIPRNGAVGIRMPSLMASDAAWVAGHRAAVAPAAGSAAVLLLLDVVAVLLRSAGMPSEVPVLGLTALLLVAIGLLALLAGRAARAVEHPTR